MIETGLYQFAIANAVIVSLSAPPPAPQTPAAAFYFSKLPKGCAYPAAVLHRVSSPNEAETLDLPAPSPQQVWGRFQINAFAQDDAGAIDPVSTSGYLAAAALSRAYRLQLMSLVGGQLPDGTAVQDIRIQDEFDANFELGGEGYLYVRVLDFKLLFLEAK